MRTTHLPVLLLVPVYLIASQLPLGQQAPSKPDVTVRTTVNLVQTDVMVFDRNDRFVPDLKLEQFQLEVDGKRQTVSFSEVVSGGSARDGASWAAGSAAANGPVRLEPVTSDLGRRLIFFVDDWHLSADSLARTRAALNNLISTSVGISDLAGIFPASGTAGFLQQLTGSKAVLRAAMEKLTFFNAPIVDKETVPMNEAQALAIEQNNPDVIGYFVDATIANTPGRYPASRALVERIVRRRALALAAQATEIAGRTLAALARTVRVFAPMPGRKVIYFLSDGFVLQTRNTDTLVKIREVTGTAARAGIVIYSLDTRGLIVGGPDAANPVRPDTSNRLARSSGSEVLETQDALNALAADTGGTFLKDTNALDTAISKTLDQTSRYYLLGWYLDRGMLEPGKYRSIRVSIKGRPDLKVRVRQGKIDLVQLAIQGQDGKLKVTPSSSNASEALLQLLRLPLPVGVLPMSFYAGYDLKPDKGFCLALAVRTEVEDLRDTNLQSSGDNRIDLAGIISNRDGETVTSFSDALMLPATADQGGLREWIYSGTLPVTPGLYQVRVAVRDSRTGHSASALEWLDVPDLTRSSIALSSIFLAAIPPGAGPAAATVPDLFDGTAISIQGTFQRSSQAAYYLHVYDLAGASLLARTKVYRGNQAVIESGFEPLSSPRLVTGRLPLEKLPSGTYILEITVKDNSRETSRKIHFRVQ